MLIKVTAEDIENGKAINCMACPIALALKRVGFKFPTVTSTHFTCDDGIKHQLPPRVGKFVVAFDSGEEVKPFSFSIDYEFPTEPPTPGLSPKDTNEV